MICSNLKISNYKFNKLHYLIVSYKDSHWVNKMKNALIIQIWTFFKTKHFICIATPHINMIIRSKSSKTLIPHSNLFCFNIDFSWNELWILLIQTLEVNCIFEWVHNLSHWVSKYVLHFSPRIYISLICSTHWYSWTCLYIDYKNAVVFQKCDRLRMYKTDSHS